MRAIRPERAKRARTHKPEEISWQCMDVRKNTTRRRDNKKSVSLLLIIIEYYFNRTGGYKYHSVN